MSIDGICVQDRGNLQLGVSLARNSILDFDERRSAFLHFAGAKRRRAQQKSGFAPLQICLGNIAARIRSLNFVGKVTGVPVPVLAQTPLLGHPRAFQRILRIKFLIVAVLVITCNGNRAFGEVKGCA